jgi:hypothetical protein
MQALYGRPVFVVEGDTFFWEDVVLDAIRRGKWSGLEQSSRGIRRLGEDRIFS